MDNAYRRELIGLRIAVARIAQSIGVQTEQLPITGMGYHQLDQLASKQDRGWNQLCLFITDRIHETTRYPNLEPGRPSKRLPLVRSELADTRRKVSPTPKPQGPDEATETGTAT
jgi:hypothetical protein